MSQRDELEFQGGAATKPEAEYGNDGGKNRDHARHGRRWRKNLQPFSVLRSFEQAGRHARRVCAECHAVLPSETTSPNAKAPTFKAVANTPGMTATALTAWFRTSHPTMPNLIIDPDDMDDLIAYILTLRDKN